MLASQVSDTPVAKNPGVRPVDRATSWALSVIVVLVIALAFALLPSRPSLTLIACSSIGGVLVAVDAIHWLRGGYDTYDPRGLFGAFGMHFYFLAPLLHEVWHFYPPNVRAPADWNASLIHWAILNAIGLLIFRLVLGLRWSRPSPPSIHPITRSGFRTAGLAGSSISVVALGYTIAQYGGLKTYLVTASEDRAALHGAGVLLLLGEAFPLILLAVTLAVHRRKWQSEPSWKLAVLFLSFVLLQFAVGGLRGSRSNTIWPVLIGLGMIHLVIRRISARKLVSMGLIGVAFMYAYSFYKSAGVQAADVLTGSSTVSELSAQTGRSGQSLALVDFGRADVQALLLDRLNTGGERTAGGATYIGDLAFLLPVTLRQALPPGKVAVGTDVWFGDGAFKLGLRNSRIYGLAGEATLNWGEFGFVISFLPLALATRFTASRYEAWKQSGDVGLLLLAPVLCISSVLLVGTDFDNLLWFVVKQVLPMSAFVAFARIMSRKNGHA